MRKTLIGSSLLVVLLLLMLPAVTAEQVKIAQSATTTNLNTIEATYMEAIRQKYKDNPSPQIILITLAILLLKLLRWGLVIIGGILILAILGILRKPNNNTSAVL
ncbi:MAG TPA: hypothetical protein VN377_06370 [Candidatus Thermoplasmatota archaeon]|nr:hypothetical protein [Candidatus Thermoplasmatota archaeon]